MTKLVFMAWGWGIRRLDFIGLSGHSAMAALLFLFCHDERWHLRGRGWLLVISVALVLPFVYGHGFPTERMLRFVAQQLSLDNTVYTRRYFREHGN